MVEFEEFVTLMRKHKALVDREADMRQAFRSFDANDDGSISREELRQAMERLGEKLSDAELDAMISAADLNKDGKARPPPPLSPTSRRHCHPPPRRPARPPTHRCTRTLLYKEPTSTAATTTARFLPQVLVCGCGFRSRR